MKSHVSQLTELARIIYYDACAKCTTNKLPEERDIDVLMSRVKDEGISFLTITLPNLGEDFERCLDLGHIAPLYFRSFKKYKKAPAFLRGFFELVFDSGTGDILDEPDIAAIEGIRQIAYTFKKLKLPCTPKRNAKAILKFKQCETDLKESLLPADIQQFAEVSDMLWSVLLSSRNLLDSVVPKHGPGATVEHISGNSKYKHRRWHDRLEPYFPLMHFCFHNENAYGCEEFEQLTVVDVTDEDPVRVITVPKTLKGPRIIAIEPVCMQYTQQGLSRNLTNLLEEHPLTSGHINFSDQSVNRSIALSASKDKRSATLDLSAASDRVPRSLALYMFNSVPDFQGAVDACRSTHANLPSGEILPLEKFASMGSALCFPIEAMYFFTLCVMALLRSRDLPVTSRNIKIVAKDVYVYGDDIIVPVDEVVEVVNTLERYYCKVNTAKSFWNGNFRESCGMDAFNGEEVTPTYIREMQPDNLRRPSALISWVETSNHFYKKGYWKTSAYMLRACSNIIGVLPIVGEKCAGLGQFSFQCLDSNSILNYHKVKNVDLSSRKLKKKRFRWNKSYQIEEILCWVAAPRYQNDIIEGYPALMKSLLRLGDKLDTNLPEAKSKDHLRETARYGSVALRSQWVRPY